MTAKVLGQVIPLNHWTLVLGGRRSQGAFRGLKVVPQQGYVLTWYYGSSSSAR